MGLWELALRAGTHEWFAGGASAEDVPAALLIALGEQALGIDVPGRPPGRCVVWIGRRVFPYPPALVRRGAEPGRGLLERSVFIDPSGHAERVWSIEQAARCGGVAAVVGDGCRLSMPESRRLQLAARVPVLLARPFQERRLLSAARTRWSVQPSLPLGVEDSFQGWDVRLLRCKGFGPQDANARVLRVRRDHVTGQCDAIDQSRQPRHGDPFAQLVDRPAAPARSAPFAGEPLAREQAVARATA